MSEQAKVTKTYITRLPDELRHAVIDYTPGTIVCWNFEPKGCVGIVDRVTQCFNSLYTVITFVGPVLRGRLGKDLIQSSNIFIGYDITEMDGSIIMAAKIKSISMTYKPAKLNEQ